MLQTPHVERHFTGSAAVRDIVIGMSDGLTVPFALAAGLSGAVDDTSIAGTLKRVSTAAGGSWADIKRTVDSGLVDIRATATAAVKRFRSALGG
jgi:hypothetical protein